jgi:ornithine decarboxylase
MAEVRAVAPKAEFHYHNPVKSRAEIARARFGFGCVRFAADDEAEIAKIADVIGSTSGVEIAVRFRLPSHGKSAHDFSSKFGATPEEAVDLLRQAVALGFAPVLTFHPGSQCTDPAAWARHIDVAAEIVTVAGVRLSALNVGGGFPWRYRDGVVPPLAAFFATIEAAANAAFAGDAPKLECEPGRGLVAGSTSLLTRVKLVKGKRGEVFINDGIYGGLMEVAQAPTLAPPHRVIRNGKPVAGVETKPFVVYGPTCDPLDRLPGALMLPVDLAEDDYIEFGSLGAYGAATATCFNGYKPAEVLEVEAAYAP